MTCLLPLSPVVRMTAARVARVVMTAVTVQAHARVGTVRQHAPQFVAQPVAMWRLLMAATSPLKQLALPQPQVALLSMPPNPPLSAYAK